MEGLSEGDGLANVGGVYPTLFIDGMTIAESSFDAPKIHVTFHRAPTTTALDEVVCHRPARVGTYHHDISLITLTEEATLAHLEKTGRVMTHQFDKTLEREYTLIHKFEHRDERELDHRHTTGSTGTATLLL